MREKAFENKLKALLKAKGCYVVKYFGCAFSQAGVPDILCCVNGKFLAIEVKGDGGRPSPLQLHNIEQIEAAGGHAVVLYPNDFEAFKSLLDDLLK